MKIENIRLGLATNSSSVHSLIFNLDASSQDWKEGQFGWDEFCCNCEPSKRLYLAVVLFDAIRFQSKQDYVRLLQQSRYVKLIFCYEKLDHIAL